MSNIIPQQQLQHLKDHPKGFEIQKVLIGSTAPSTDIYNKEFHVKYTSRMSANYDPINTYEQLNLIKYLLKKTFQALRKRYDNNSSTIKIMKFCPALLADEISIKDICTLCDVHYNVVVAVKHKFSLEMRKQLFFMKEKDSRNICFQQNI